MMRTLVTSAVALGALLMFNGAASAGDNTPSKAWNNTMTLGGQGTLADATTEDLELTAHGGGHGGYHGGGYHGGGYHGGYGGYHGGYRGGYYGGGYRGYYGGYRGYYGGYGYRGYPYYAGYRGYYGYPRYYGGYGYGWGLGFGYGWPWGYGGYYRPYYYSSYYYPNYYGYGGYGYSGYCGIGGTAEDADAPVVTLNMAVVNSPFRPREAQPAATPTPATKALETSLPISLMKSNSASPYTYKAYGEK